MSTKFFHGVWLDDVNPIAWTLDARAALEPTWRRLAEQAVGTVMAELQNCTPTEVISDQTWGEVTSLPDRFGRIKDDRVAAAAIVEHINDEVRAMRYPVRFATAVDLMCSVSVFHSSKFDFTFAKIFTDREELRAVFMALPGVTNFEYWDNADRPDDVTRTAWKHRRAIVDDAIGDRTYAEAGVSIRCDNYGVGSLGDDVRLARAGEWLSAQSIAATMKGSI